MGVPWDQRVVRYVISLEGYRSVFQCKSNTRQEWGVEGGRKRGRVGKRGRREREGGGKRGRRGRGREGGEEREEGKREEGEERVEGEERERGREGRA